MQKTEYPPFSQNARYFSYTFIGQHSKDRESYKIKSGTDFSWEMALIHLYEACRTLQVSARVKDSDYESWRKRGGKNFPLSPNTVQLLIPTYLPFYDPEDKSRFRFRDKALAELGFERLRTLGPIVTQLFSNLDADFCRNFYVSEWTVEFLDGADKDGNDKWRDFREIAADKIRDYYYLANLDQNGKPLPLPEEDIGVMSYDDFDFSDMFQ